MQVFSLSDGNKMPSKSAEYSEHSRYEIYGEERNTLIYSEFALSRVLDVLNCSSMVNMKDRSPLILS